MRGGGRLTVGESSRDHLPGAVCCVLIVRPAVRDSRPQGPVRCRAAWPAPSRVRARFAMVKETGMCAGPR